MADYNLTDKLNMPSLEGLETSLRSKRALGHFLGIHGPPTPRGRQMADGYVRLVEKTMLEYSAARETLLKYLKDGYADVAIHLGWDGGQLAGIFMQYSELT